MMVCNESCPRKLTNCIPFSNIVSDNNETFVCVGTSDIESRSCPEDKFRHCFKSDTTDSMYDYDTYDLKSVIAVMSAALLLDEIIIQMNDNTPSYQIEELIKMGYMIFYLEKEDKYIMGKISRDHIYITLDSPGLLDGYLFDPSIGTSITDLLESYVFTD